MPSNFRCEGTIQDFLKEQDIPGIAGIDTRALTKILREKGTMNGMITTNENYNLDEVLPKLHAYKVGDVVSKVTCSEKYVLEGNGPKVALMDFGAKNNIARSLNDRGCEVTVYPANTPAEEIISANPECYQHLQHNHGSGKKYKLFLSADLLPDGFRPCVRISTYRSYHRWRVPSADVPDRLQRLGSLNRIIF